MNVMIYLPIILAAIILVASLIHRRLMKSVQPLRLELARKGEALLASDLPAEVHEHVKFMLDAAFPKSLSLLVCVPVVPILMVAIMFRPALFRAVVLDRSRMAPETRVRHDDAIRLFRQISFANHPMLRSLIDAEVALAIGFAMLVLAIIRGRFPGSVERDVVMSVVERPHHLHMMSKHAA